MNDERKLVRNRGEVDAWYIEDDHEAIVSPELWQKAQDALDAKRDYLAEGSIIEEFTEENYPYMNKIFCAECGYPLYRRIYSKGNRLNWGCSGTKRFGKSFCKGINIPDGILREAWDFDGNMYIGEKLTAKGTKKFTYLKEISWKEGIRGKSRSRFLKILWKRILTEIRSTADCAEADLYDMWTVKTVRSYGYAMERSGKEKNSARERESLILLYKGGER